MSFQKKPKHSIIDSRTHKYEKLVSREYKVASLREEKTPEARKQLKKMNDVVYRKGRSNLREWYAPKGKKLTANQ